MEFKERLDALHIQQQHLIEAYGDLLDAYDSDQMIHEYNDLKSSIAIFKKEIETLREELAKARQEKNELQVALHEQVWNERLNILKISKEKMDIYFKEEWNNQKNKLSDLEMEIRNRLMELKAQTRRHLNKEKDQYHQRIDELSRDLDEKLKQQASRLLAEQNSLRQESFDKMDALGEEELGPEILKARVRQNQIEMKIGLNWFNKIGIILILFGVGAAFQYSYDKMPDMLKSIIFFALGGLFMMAGEFMFRRKKETFATGLLGGGIAILYGSIFYSFFALKLNMPIQTALILSILVTACTIVLSIRYNSKTIGIFGLIGGYLPFISWVSVYGLNENMIPLLMGYLFLLNLSVLLIAFCKEWSLLNIVSFLLNMASLYYLAVNSAHPLLSMGYTLITFLMYLSVVLVYPFKHHKSLANVNVVLLALNTLCSSILLFYLADLVGLQQLRGLTSLIFAFIYLGLGQFVLKALPNERWTQLLFYATSLTFAILIVPLQFIHWLALGWLIEGILLIVLGSRNRIQPLEIAGWSVFGVCLGIFGLTELIPKLMGASIAYFEVKYLLFNLGQMIILGNYLLLFKENIITKWSSVGQSITAFKYFFIAFFWIYLLHLDYLACERLLSGLPDYGFYYAVSTALISIIYGLALNQLKFIIDKVVKGFAIALYILSDLICLGLTIAYPVLQSYDSPMHAASYIALGILIAYNVLVFMSIRSLLLTHLQRQGHHLELYPLWLGIYLFAITNALLIVQFHLGQVNFLLSIVYLMLAIAYICYGFAKRYTYIRRFGLGLTLIATLKLLLWDLSFLDTGGRIIAYFAFGLVLLAISFIYQKVKNNLEGNNHDSLSA